jgi:hypothetical protein
MATVLYYGYIYGMILKSSYIYPQVSESPPPSTKINYGCALDYAYTLELYQKVTTVNQAA